MSLTLQPRAAPVQSGWQRALIPARPCWDQNFKIKIPKASKRKPYHLPEIKSWGKFVCFCKGNRKDMKDEKAFLQTMSFGYRGEKDSIGTFLRQQTSSFACARRAPVHNASSVFTAGLGSLRTRQNCSNSLNIFLGSILLCQGHHEQALFQLTRQRTAPRGCHMQGCSDTQRGFQGAQGQNSQAPRVGGGPEGVCGQEPVPLTLEGYRELATRTQPSGTPKPSGALPGTAAPARVSGSVCAH